MFYQYGFFKPLVALKIGRIMTLRQLVPAAFVLSVLVSVLAAPWVAAARVLGGLILGRTSRRTPRARSRSGGDTGRALALLSPGSSAGACLLRLWVPAGALALLARSRGRVFGLSSTPLSR